MRLFKPNNNFNVVGLDLFGSKKRVKFKYKLDKKVQNWHKPNTINQKEIIKKCNEWGFKNIKLYAGDVKVT